MLTRSDLLRALAQRGQELRVSDVMRRDYQLVDSSEMLQTALARLESCECHTLPVTRHGQLVGLVAMEYVGEFLMIQAALAQRKAMA